MKKTTNNKKIRKKKIITLSTIIIIIIAIIIIIMLKPKKEVSTVKYNNFTFEKTGGLKNGTLWRVRVKDSGPYQYWWFYFNPKQLEDIQKEGKLSYNFTNSPRIFITFNPYGNYLGYDAIATADLTIGLRAYFNKTILPACIKNASACVKANATIINCSEANKEKKATIFLDQEYARPAVIYDNYCVIIRGYKDDLIRSQEYFLMNYYGIIPNKK